MPQIIPIKDLRDTNRISEICNSSDNPIFITKNGYGDMVIMSISAYEKRLAQLDMYNAINDGLKDVEKNNLIDGENVLKSLKAKYEI